MCSVFSNKIKQERSRMPKSIKKPSAEVRCSACEKLLATPEGIKCPRCKKVHTFEEHFAEELVPDQFIVSYLWTRDGSQASSILIRKEVWLNLDYRSTVPESPSHYPVFFVYNYMDPSRAFASDVGCRVNMEPLLNFQSALTLAKEHEIAARNCGKWVEVADVVEPELQKPENGI